MISADSPSIFPFWWREAAVHQDFAWFAAVVGWSFVLILWRRLPEARAEWSWVVPAATVGLVTGLLPFLVYSPPFDFFQDRLRPGTVNNYRPAWISVELTADFLLTTAWAGLVVAWSWGSGKRGRRLWRRRLGWMASAVVVTGWHFIEPTRAGSALAALGLAAGVMRGARPGCRGRIGLGLMAMAPAVSAVGPMAVSLGELQRDVSAGSLGLVAAGLQLVVIGGLLARFFPVVWAHGGGSDRALSRREGAWFLAGGVVWLTLGLTFAWVTGRDNRQELHTNRLRSTAAAAELFDARSLEGLVGANLQFQRWQDELQGEGAAWVVAPGLRGPAAAALRRELNHLVRRTPFVDEARVMVMHEGWVAVVAASRPPAVPGEVVLVRRLTPEDEAAVAAGEPYIETVPAAEVGRSYFTRAPIRDDAGRVVAWLDYQRTEFFQSMARKWRAGPLLITALGLVLGAVSLSQRRVAREREQERRARDLAEETNRWQMLFLAKVSHELRTPLQSVLGYGELLARDARDGPTRTRVAALREHGEMMRRLVNDLLELGSLRHGGVELRPVVADVPEVVARAVDVFRAAAEAKGLRLRYELKTAGPGWSAVDVTRLRQIIFNLVGNAVKFTDAGEVVVTLSRDLDGWHLVVRDTGPGIAPAARVELFQPFARLDQTAAKEGSGLGLALVAAMATAMGGGVRETGRPGVGACFEVTLVLPAAQPDERADDELPRTPPVPWSDRSLAGRRVLVADDNPLVRDWVLEVLAEQGALCETAASGNAAYALAATGRFDVLVLDMAMPGMTGGEVARRLRAEASWPDLRIVGLSAHVDAEGVNRARADGMDESLSKPVSVGRLVAAVAGVERGSRSEFVAPARNSHLERLFRDDLDGQMAKVQAAGKGRDAPGLAREAHYLRNSAVVVGDRDLGAACAALEDLARHEAWTGWDATWAETKAAARRWQTAAQGVG